MIKCSTLVSELMVFSNKRPYSNKQFVVIDAKEVLC